jgi:hypothetical protein
MEYTATVLFCLFVLEDMAIFIKYAILLTYYAI